MSNVPTFNNIPILNKNNYQHKVRSESKQICKPNVIDYCYIPSNNIEQQTINLMNKIFTNSYDCPVCR